MKQKITTDLQGQYLDQLLNHPDQIATSAADQAMLAYAVKLTVTPSQMTREDVERLSEHGFNEQAIHDVCAIASYFAFANRIADGLGVELEERT